MLLFLNPQAQWDSSDAKHLQDFLHSATGQKMLGQLNESAPEFDTGENPNVALVSAGRREGYELALKSIFDLTVNQPEPVQESYSGLPDLDDDKQWPKELQADYVVPTIAPKEEPPTQQ